LGGEGACGKYSGVIRVSIKYIFAIVPTPGNFWALNYWALVFWARKGMASPGLTGGNHPYIGVGSLQKVQKGGGGENRRHRNHRGGTKPLWRTL